MTWVITALAVLGWILLGILALFLLIILLTFILMAAPIRYEVSANVGEKTTATIKVSYFFRLIYFVYKYDDNIGTSTLRILGFRKKMNFGDFKPKNDDSAKKEILQKLKLNKGKNKEKEANEHENEEKLGLGKIVGSIRTVLTYPHRKTIINLSLCAIKKTCKVLKPKKINISGIIGFEDPATTGFFLGAYECLAGMLKARQHIRLAGDFNASSTTVQLELFVKGSISGLRLTWPILWLAWQKPIRGLIWGAITKG